MVLVVALDALRRVGLAHAPAHREREHLRQASRRQRLAAIRSRRCSVIFRCKRVDVGEDDVGDLGVRAEVRARVVRERAPVFPRRDRALARQVLGLEPSISSATVGAARSASISASGSPPASISRRSSLARARAAVVVQSGNWPMVRQRSRPRM